MTQGFSGKGISRQAVDQLADEIAVTAARIDSATHHLLTLIRRFDEVRGWAVQGAQSCAEWLSWRIGVGPVAAREKVRVARALGELPHIDAAVKQGRVSYCKARAMTRVATAGNEALLLEQATSATGAQLERVCRGLRRVDAIATDTTPERHVRKCTDSEGMVRIELRLQPDEAAQFYTALHEMKRQLSAEGGDDVSEETTPTLADAAVAMAEQQLAAETSSETAARPVTARRAAERRMLLVHLRDEDVAAAARASEETETRTLRAELADGTVLRGDTLLRIACDCGLVGAHMDDTGNVLDIGRKRRSVSAPLMRALMLRDRHCVFPGCTCTAYLEAHHIEHWMQGGETTLANTAILCWRHHAVLHEGGFGMQRDPAGVLRFFDPDGHPIDAAPRAPELTEPGLVTLASEQTRAGLPIDRGTSLPDWTGTPLRLHDAVSALARRA